MTTSDQRVIDTIARAVKWHLFEVAEIVVAALKADERIAVVELPEQHLGLQNDEDVVAEFRFGDDGGSVISASAGKHAWIYVVGGVEEMPLELAREFAVAFLAAVIAGEAVAS